MKRGFLRLTAMAAAVGAMSVASAALAADPPTDISRFDYIEFWGGASADPNYMNFFANREYGEDYVYVGWEIGGVYQSILCEGPALIALLNVGPETASLKATLDPASPACRVYGEFSAPVTLDVSGVSSPSYGYSETGTITYQSLEQVTRSNIRRYGYDCSFAMAAPLPGWTGACNASRVQILERAK